MRIVHSCEPSFERWIPNLNCFDCRKFQYGASGSATGKPDTHIEHNVSSSFFIDGAWSNRRRVKKVNEPKVYRKTWRILSRNGYNMVTRTFSSFGTMKQYSLTVGGNTNRLSTWEVRMSELHCETRRFRHLWAQVNF
jgi:predicted sugar kinase